MKYFVTVGEQRFEVDLSGERSRIDGEEVDADLITIPGTPLRNLVTDGRSRTVSGKPGARKGEWEITVGGERVAARAIDERTHAILELTGGEADIVAKTVDAPMPGLVVKVLVEKGQTVSAGQSVVVVEAMKMENELKAPTDGVVESISVEQGQTVEKGQVLVVFEA